MGRYVGAVFLAAALIGRHAGHGSAVGLSPLVAGFVAACLAALVAVIVVMVVRPMGRPPARRTGLAVAGGTMTSLEMRPR